MGTAMNSEHQEQKAHMGKWIFHLPPKVKVLGSSPSMGVMASFLSL